MALNCTTILTAKQKYNHDEFWANDPRRSKPVLVETRATSIAARVRSSWEQSFYPFRATRTVECVRHNYRYTLEAARSTRYATRSVFRRRPVHWHRPDRGCAPLCVHHDVNSFCHRCDRMSTANADPAMAREGLWDLHLPSGKKFSMTISSKIPKNKS